jgi:hypothetical protein
MTTQEFLALLAAHPQQALVFDYGEGQVEPGYHVTEVMNVSYESMDCGGQANFWRETVVQLMGPSRLDAREYMSVQKFLRIYGKVAAAVPVRPESEVRFEYGDAKLPAIHYHVAAVEVGDQVVVRLSSPGVACKAADRKIEAIACCSPVQNAISNVVWGDSAPNKCC